MRCPGCQVECPPEARFCRSCGRPLPALCPGCGTPAAGAEVRFCRSCGTAIPAAGPPPAAPAIPAAGPPVPAVPAGASPSAPAAVPAESEPAVPAGAQEEWTLEPGEEPPLVLSEVVQAATRAGQVATRAGRVLKDPERLLKPAAAAGAASRLNVLELLAMAGVGGLIGVFYMFGLVVFGLKQMITSGTPFFAIYSFGLMVGLALFRNVLDKPLAPIFRAMQKIPPWLRLVLGVLAPLAWVLWDSKDVGSGFTHAMKTVTIATALGHVFFRSLRRPPS